MSPCCRDHHHCHHHWAASLSLAPCLSANSNSTKSSKSVYLVFAETYSAQVAPAIDSLCSEDVLPDGACSAYLDFVAQLLLHDACHCCCCRLLLPRSCCWPFAICCQGIYTCCCCKWQLLLLWQLQVAATPDEA